MAVADYSDWCARDSNRFPASRASLFLSSTLRQRTQRFATSTREANGQKGRSVNHDKQSFTISCVSRLACLVYVLYHMCDAGTQNREVWEYFLLPRLRPSKKSTGFNTPVLHKVKHLTNVTSRRAYSHASPCVCPRGSPRNGTAPQDFKDCRSNAYGKSWLTPPPPASS